MTLTQYSISTLLDALHQSEEVIIPYSTIENTKRARDRFTGSLTEVIQAYFESTIALNDLFSNFTYLLQVCFEKNKKSLGIRSFTNSKEDLVDFFCLIRGLIKNEYTAEIILCITSPELKYLASQYTESDLTTREGRFLLKNSILGIDSVYMELWHAPTGLQLLYRTITIKH